MKTFTNLPKKEDTFNQHGVTVKRPTDEVKPEDFSSLARLNRESWRNYKKNEYIEAGKGKRKSLGLAPQRLLALSFDPIEAKVRLAEKYEEELIYHEMCRQGLVINPATEEPRSYSATAHNLVMAAYDRCINDLLRYGYARVSEKDTDTGEDFVPSTINLSLSDEDVEDLVNEASEEGVIENTRNIREIVRKEIRNFKVPLKTFKGGTSEDGN